MQLSRYEKLLLPKEAAWWLG